METSVPSLSSSTNSQLIKLFNSAGFSTLAAMHAVAVPTLLGAVIGSRVLSIDIEQDDLRYDMMISGLTMGALGMLSYPYQYSQNLPPFEIILEIHPYWALILFVTVPIILPLIVNEMMRENDFPEWKALALGGAIAQILIAVVIRLVVGLIIENKTAGNFIDSFAEYTISEEKGRLAYRSGVVRRQEMRQGSQRKESLSFTMINKSYATVRRFRETVTLKNARLMIRNIKLAMMRPAIKRLLNAWHAEFRDPYSEFVANNLYILEHYDEWLLHREEELKAQQAAQQALEESKPEADEIKSDDEDSKIDATVVKRKKKKKVEPTLKLSDISPNRAAFFQPPNVTPLNLSDCLQVNLSEFEKNIFAFLDAMVPTKDHTYKTYIVGGWAYDRVRETVRDIPPCPDNDIDIVTEIPPEILAGIFYKVDKVSGLYSGTFHNIKVDILHKKDLSDLLLDAKTRDFMTFYLDKTGKVYDPTKHALANLHLNVLYSANPREKIFKDDPLVILRAIYVATKRNLLFDNLKDMMIADSLPLLQAVQNFDAESETLLHPRRINIYIKKLFSQGCATKNMAILNELTLLPILFPSIYLDMGAAYDWIQEQIAITNTKFRPKLSIIYATFIAPAIVHRSPYLPYFQNDDAIVDSNILTIVDEVGKSSPLFKNEFGSPMELYNMLRRPLKNYIQFYNSKTMAASMSLNMFASIR
jgi:hypothetical protein